MAISPSGPARAAVAAPAEQLCSPAGGTSSEFTVTGWVAQEETYDATRLAALPQTTVADTFLSGGGSTSRNYTGVELWRLLGLGNNNTIGSLILPNDPAGPQGAGQSNDITRYSVLVTGSDCFQAVFAMTEITPFFGGKPVVVATAQGAYAPGDDPAPVTESLGGAGFARISNPSDVRGSRRVSNIVEIRVLPAPVEASTPPSGAPTCAGGTSSELVVDGYVAAPQTYDAAALAALPQTTVADTFLSGGGSTSANYTGVELWRLLGLSADSASIGSLILPNDPGPQHPDPQRNDLTRYSVMVTGSDCFQGLFSLAEISPFFGGNPFLIATAQGPHDPDDTTTPVTGDLGANGFARVSAPVDVRGSRRVSNIVQITVLPPPQPIVEWAPPAPITEGTPLGADQLSAVATFGGAELAGDYVFGPPAGTVLAAGTHELSVVFSQPAPSRVGPARGVVTLTVDAASEPPADDFQSLAPARLMDSRPGSSTVDGLDVGAGPVAAGETIELQVGDRGGVPPDATAVALNITATETSGWGYATVHPCGGTVPNASTLNFTDAGQTVANAAIAQLGADGSVCITVGEAATQLIVDVNGYLPTGSTLHTFAPQRLADTRDGTSTIDGVAVGDGPRAAGTTLTLPVAGRGEVPADAAAVVLNVTATNTDGWGYVAAYPCGAAAPGTSSLNYTVAGTTVANAAIVAVGDGGAVCFDVAVAGTDLVVDVSGYATDGSTFSAVGPARLADTRDGTSTIDGAGIGSGPLEAGSVLEVPVIGRPGVPTDTSTAILNVTASGAAGWGYLTVYPCGATVPNASNVNYPAAGATVANTVLTGVDADGKICVFVGAAATDVIVDIVGTFT